MRIPMLVLLLVLLLPAAPSASKSTAVDLALTYRPEVGWTFEQTIKGEDSRERLDCAPVDWGYQEWSDETR